MSTGKKYAQKPFNPAMRTEEENHLPLESELRMALQRQQISVLYQPITRLATNQLAGLMRQEAPGLTVATGSASRRMRASMAGGV